MKSSCKSFNPENPDSDIFNVMEKLVGILERIVFENAETGYTIARLTSRDYPTELITVVGNLAAAECW